MGGYLSFEQDKTTASVEEVKKYCESVVFVRFNGQTNKFNCTDHEAVDGPGQPESELGHILHQLDQIIRMATTVNEFEITEPIKKILKMLAEIRVCTEDCESVDKCYERLLEDAEKFAKIYQERGCKSEVLENHHSFYWGTRQQMLFGKVICDWLAEHKNAPMDPIFGTLLNPTGGRVGPGDTGFFHDSLFDNMGPFAYHSAVHDGFGYLKTNHKTGPGYNYLNKGIFGDWSPLGGQYSGLEFWNETCEKLEPEKADESVFVMK